MYYILFNTLTWVILVFVWLSLVISEHWTNQMFALLVVGIVLVVVVIDFILRLVWNWYDFKDRMDYGKVRVVNIVTKWIILITGYLFELSFQYGYIYPIDWFGLNTSFIGGWIILSLFNGIILLIVGAIFGKY